VAEGGGLLNQNPLANSRPLKAHIFNHYNGLIAVSGGKISIAEGSKSGSTMPFMGACGSTGGSTANAGFLVTAMV
jgi:hypothetical protein